MRWDSTLAESHNNLGLIFHEKQDLGQAIDQYQRAVQMDAVVGFYHSNVGNAHLDMNQLVQAKQAFERALDLVAGLTNARILLGDIHARRGAHARAIELWESIPSDGSVGRTLRDKLAEARRRLAAQRH